MQIYICIIKRNTMNTQKKIWLERKNWLTLMLNQCNEAVASINLFENIDNAHASELVAKEEEKYSLSMIHLRACHNRPMVSNAKDITTPSKN